MQAWTHRPPEDIRTPAEFWLWQKDTNMSTTAMHDLICH